jgi:O-antigen/teichoic acid export membrane protein
MSAAKYVLFFGIPLIPHVMGGYLMFNIDRYVINSMFNLHYVGLYILAIQCSLPAKIFFLSIQRTITPVLYELLSCQESARSIVKRTYLYIFFLVLASLIAFPVVEPLILLVVPEDYKPAAVLVSWLLLGRVFHGIYLHFSIFILFEKRTLTVSVITCISAIIGVAGLFVLLPIHGLIGAAYSFCGASAVRALLSYIVVVRVTKLPWINGYFTRS